MRCTERRRWVWEEINPLGLMRRNSTCHFSKDGSNPRGDANLYRARGQGRSSRKSPFMFLTKQDMQLGNERSQHGGGGWGVSGTGPIPIMTARLLRNGLRQPERIQTLHVMTRTTQPMMYFKDIVSSCNCSTRWTGHILTNGSVRPQQLQPVVTRELCWSF